MIKPMLAGRCTDTSKLVYPVLCTPKIDGIRAVVVNRRLVSRKWKPIPNQYVRDMFSDLPDFVDGELVGYDTNGNILPFNKSSSLIMGDEEKPDVRYLIFDHAPDIEEPYKDRVKRLLVAEISAHKNVVILMPVLLRDEAHLLAYEQVCLFEGYEGIMIRSLNGPYKEGRSTEREGYLLKLKRFTDSEAKVIGFEERMHNANEAKKDAFGRTERSSAKAGLVPDGTLGKLLVRDIQTSVEFEIGTGFDDEMRAHIWKSKKTWLGKIVKYKYQECGTVDKPRFPVYLGVRDERDMS